MKRPWEHQPWVEPYRLALLETNLDELSQRVHVAKNSDRRENRRTGKLEKLHAGTARTQPCLEDLARDDGAWVSTVPLWFTS
jgi:hypothetical protein